MTQSISKSYPYKPNPGVMILCVIFFGLCTIVIANKAMESSSTYHWILTACSVGFVLIGTIALIQSALPSLDLVLTETEIRIPKGFVKKTHVTVPLVEIVSMTETKINGQTFLNLKTPKKKHCVNRSLMPDKESYEELKELVGRG